ncbi:MAG: outer membrane protein assembly factor BamD, partial [Bacteroidota bacterium]
MKVLKYRLFVGGAILLFLCLSVPLQAQKNKELQLDPIAQDLIAQGKRFLRVGNYKLAWNAFESAVDRPFHQGTTAAIYLSGLAALEGKQESLALKRFEEIIKEYPLSIYVEEALYHRGLIYLQADSRNLQQTGMLELLELAENARDPQMKRDAMDAVKAYTFENLSLYQLENLYDQAQLSQKPLFLVPLLYRMLEDGQKEDAESYYGDYLWMGGNEIPYVDRLLSEEVVRPVFAERSVMKLALVLPAFYEQMNPFEIDSLPEIPGKSKVALEFYEGFETALEEYQRQGQKKIFVRVLDSQRDSLATEEVVDNLYDFKPDLVIG